MKPLFATVDNDLDGVEGDEIAWKMFIYSANWLR